MTTRTDSDLARDVLAELRWTPDLTAIGVRVGASEGTVTLRGWMLTAVEKRTAIQVAQRVRGVGAVVSELDVRLPSMDVTATSSGISVATGVGWTPEVRALIEDALECNAATWSSAARSMA